MKPINLILSILIIALIALMFFGSQKQKTLGKVIQGDIFEGIITNIEIGPGILDGTGVYDRSCNPIENGLTQCDAGIQTEKGLLNFNYKHNMHAQGCIDQGQKLKVEISEGGKAKVTRL